MATPTIVSIDDYLGRSFDPDVEYIDGELKERPVDFSIHDLLQSLISIWFGKHEEEFQVKNSPIHLDLVELFTRLERYDTV